jgi:hypothetical protein
MFSKTQILLSLALLASKAVLAHGNESMDMHMEDHKTEDHYSHTMESVQPTGYATPVSKTASYGTTATVYVDSGAHQIGAFIALLGPLFAL